MWQCEWGRLPSMDAYQYNGIQHKPLRRLQRRFTPSTSSRSSPTGMGYPLGTSMTKLCQTILAINWDIYVYIYIYRVVHAERPVSCFEDLTIGWVVARRENLWVYGCALKKLGTPQLWCFILICPIRPYQHWKTTIFGGLTPWFIPMLRHFPMKIATHRWPWLPLPLPNRPVPDAQPRWTTPVNAARISSRKNSLETWCLYLPDYVLTIHIPRTCTNIYI